MSGRGGARPGAGRKPYPAFGPEEVVIDVRNMRAHVARWERETPAFRLIPADNWEELETRATEEIEALGGGIMQSGIYPCSAALAAAAHFSE